MAQTIAISDYVSQAPGFVLNLPPWEACSKAADILETQFAGLSTSYKMIERAIAVHHTATVEPSAILKAPCVIGANCFIAAFVYLRGGVWLDSNVTVGPSAEVKSSFVFGGSSVAHLNFVGNSVIGRNVNIEAGVVLANYRNERDAKEIICFDGRQYIHTGHEKFGSLIGDGCRIGANAVLAPGTVLAHGAVVERLALIDQSADAI
jgi:bifunctional N-acetylglucosamine-1-phosphate-uridyltransferase/glucosamine-1-phosphate-acetyltransferase GlmU-like protein